MRHLDLPEHVFVCLDGDYVVFLDLRKDRYWAVEAEQTLGLANLVCGWPARISEPGATTADPDMIRVLIERGLLSEARDRTRDATPVRVAPPRLELLQPGLDVPAAKRYAPSLLLAATIAAIAVRCRPFESVIARTRRRKHTSGARAAQFDLDLAAQLVSAFERLRPLLFSARDACLFNSFVLVEFFARHDLFPDWVFGVQARPFAAHCWVQHEGIVFNDTADHVRRYTPIMAV